MTITEQLKSYEVDLFQFYRSTIMTMTGCRMVGMTTPISILQKYDYDKGA